MLNIPRSRFEFGQPVTVHWQEIECGTTDAHITGINYDCRRGRGIEYTITEPDGQQTDGIDESMLHAR